MTGAAFDTLAARYDALWSDTAIGRSQREAVWRWTDPLFHRGQRILDLGCGTGADAVHFRSRGVHVQAIDASGEMVGQAVARGVDARQWAIEELPGLGGTFDGAISNFGALNCVAKLDPVARELARLIQPGGNLAVCLIGPSCVREIAHYLLRGRVKKAFRRWTSVGQVCNLRTGFQPVQASEARPVVVYYPTLARIVRAFRPYFQLVRWTGIGLFVPPSYVTSTSVARLAALDRRLAHLPLARGLADHRLLVFQRI